MNYAKNRELWEQRVENFTSSKLTQEVWCEENDVKVTALRYWLKKLRDEAADQENSWVRLAPITQNTESPTQLSKSLLTIHIGYCRIEVSEGFCPGALKDVAKTLSELC